mgnify:CR=1 FL=1
MTVACASFPFELLSRYFPCFARTEERERKGIPRSPSPEPMYDGKGMRTNTRLQRRRDAIMKQRQVLIAEYAKLNPTAAPPAGVSKNEAKLTKRYDIPIDKVCPAFILIFC